MTNSTCVCGRPFHRHDTLNVVVDALSNGCKKFTPAPTPAEGEEPTDAELIAYAKFRGRNTREMEKGLCINCDYKYFEGDEKCPRGCCFYPIDPFQDTRQQYKRENRNAAASQQAPADHPDLVSEWLDSPELEKARQDALLNASEWELNPAQAVGEGVDIGFRAGMSLARQQATSPDAVIDEFVERVKEPFEYRSRVSDDEWRESLRSVAEEMKRK